MNPLLKNAVVSIQLGLEDFAADDERRIISAARNVYAGTLLLAKEVLRRWSPPSSNELLVRAHKRAVREEKGGVRLVGHGRNTINRPETQRTFRELQLDTDLRGLDRLAEIRNDIEHRHSEHAPELIREAIADATPIIRDLIVRELKEQPASLLGKDSWDLLLKQAEVLKIERDACRSSFAGINWASTTLEAALRDFRCPRCSTSLVRNDNMAARNPQELALVCSRCGEPSVLEEVVEAALEKSLWAESYVAAKEGSDPVLEECPECLRATYVLAERKCLTPDCGFSLPDYDCAICHEPLTLEDYRDGRDGLCGYHAHMLLKDD